MSTITHTWPVQDAKNRFSELIDLARTQGDQLVTRHGKPVAMVVAYSEAMPSRTVTVSVEHYEALRRQAQGASRKLTSQEFAMTYKDWIDDQHRIVEEVGIFGEEYRVW